VSHDTRRVAPAIWHTDWLQLGPLARHCARGQGAAKGVMVDYGCGGMPYAAMMRDWASIIARRY
jgi:hypothetical protein